MRDFCSALHGEFGRFGELAFEGADDQKSHGVRSLVVARPNQITGRHFSWPRSITLP
jgi:hypothetical protein